MFSGRGFIPKAKVEEPSSIDNKKHGNVTNKTLSSINPLSTLGTNTTTNALNLSNEVQGNITTSGPGLHTSNNKSNSCGKNTQQDTKEILKNYRERAICIVSRNKI